LHLFGEEQGKEVTAIASEVNRAVTGYMLGNFLTSAIAGIVVFVALFSMNVPFPFLWALWVALVDFLPMIGGALAGIPTILFAFTTGVPAGIVTAIVFLAYTQIENHILNPIIMSRTVRISPLLVLISVLVGASIGSWVGGLFGGFVAALLSIPAAGAAQVIALEAWRLSGPPQQPREPPLPERDGPAATSAPSSGEEVTREAAGPGVEDGPAPQSISATVTVSETITQSVTAEAPVPARRRD
jgi:predicted PurR-regulated permease PerM